jgi:hypothetical protein
LPDDANRFGKAEILSSLFNLIPTVHGVVFTLFVVARSAAPPAG